MRIIPRSQWGARHANGWPSATRTLPIKIDGRGGGEWLHHSAGFRPPANATFAQDSAAVRGLESIGQSRFGRGISYQDIVTPSGRIFEGITFTRKGAHTVGHNSWGASICWPGNYVSTNPTPAQIEATAWLLAERYRRGQIDAPRLKGGHRDAPGNSTACPGNSAHRHIAQINGRAAQIASGAPPTNPAPPAEPAPPAWETPAHMRAVQKLLNFVTDAGLVEDGIRGPATEAATLHYQTEYRTDLTKDGSPGPATYAALQEDEMTIAEIKAQLDRLPADVWGRLMNRAGETKPTVRADTLLRYTADRGGLARVEAALAEVNGHEVDVQALAADLLPLIEEAIAETNTDAQAQAIVEAIGRKLAPQED